jgi:hypothetical protein
MRTAIRVAGALVGVTGLILLILGMAFWTGHARALIPLHMLIGLVFVLGMWWVAALASRAGAPKRLVRVAFLWGAIVLLFGLTQQSVHSGPARWVVQVVHLLLGLGGLGIAGVLGKKAREAGAPPAADPRA